MTRATNILLLAAALAGAQSDPLVSGIESYSKGDYIVAERLLTEAAKGKDPRAGAFLAFTQAATGRCDAARPGLDKALGSSDAAIRRLAGLASAQCHTTAGRFDEAAALLSRLRAESPGDADVLYQAARLQMRAWNDTIYQLYKHNPSSFRVNQISGEIFETHGKFNEAVAEYRKAIEKNPKALNLHFRLGRAILMSSHSPENLDAARKEFEAELALNPSDSIAEFQIAQILLAQNKSDEAQKRLETALKLKPDFPEALIAMGKLRMDQKKDADAVALLRKAVALAPSSEAAHYNLMLAYRNSGDMAAARKQKAELDKLQKPPEGEFTEFLKKLGETPPSK
jgi:tetratricopeptide (TPR) repeat protein